MSVRFFPRPRILVAAFGIIFAGLLMPTFGPRGRHSMAATPSGWTGPVLIQAAGRGNPYVNFEDGRAVPASFSSATGLTSALSDPATKGLALASADFDEDGMPDLVASYETSDGGLLSLHFGNVDAVYPNAPEAKERRAKGTFVDAPFLPDAKLFETPERPDFVGAGDFDADGHWDVVTARNGGSSLSLHRGDGAGGLLPPESLPLPGAVTALATGDVNRRDGLEDVLVGVVSQSGPRLLVFEWPEGALRGEPEAIELPEPAHEIAMGRFRARHPVDILVASTRSLHQIEGRDRRLGQRDSRTPPPTVVSTELPFEIAAVATGDFNGDWPAEPALLGKDGILRWATTLEEVRSREMPLEQVVMTQAGLDHRATLIRLNASPLKGDEFLAFDPSGDSLLLAGTDPACKPVKLGLTEDPAAVLGMRLNGDALSDLVVLSAQSTTLAGLQTSPLATFTVTNTNDSGPGSLRAAIGSANSSPGADLLTFAIPGGPPHQINLLTSLPWVVESLQIDGTTEPDFPSLGRPVVILDGTNLPVVPTQNGLIINAEGILVRGLSFLDFYDFNAGILGGSRSNIIEGNLFGLDATATVPTEVAYGLELSAGSEYRIGGTVPPARNLFSSDGSSGIDSNCLANENLIQGNFVGTDLSGGSPIGSLFEGFVLPGNFNVVGGTAPGAGNVIAGTRQAGVVIALGITCSPAMGNIIQGNLIGTDATGTASIPNDTGVLLADSVETTVGGTTSASRNIVAGNLTDGIRSERSTGVTIAGNHVGVLSGGITALPNGGMGILIQDGLDHQVGSFGGGRNLVSGNTLGGIGLKGPNTASVTVQNNLIGTDVNGSLPLGNGGHGIEIVAASSNLIGGSFPGEPNVIRFNGGVGISVRAGAGGGGGTANDMRQNSISDNGMLGIDLGGDGVTPNDPNDPDLGPNALQNYPVLDVSTTTGGEVRVAGTLNSQPSTTYAIQFFASAACDPSGHGEGEKYLGTSSVTTNASGTASFGPTFTRSVAAGNAVTAVASGPGGYTSEFSNCVSAFGVPPGLVPEDVHFDVSAGTDLAWSGVAGAIFYHVYRGTPSGLPELVTTKIDSCSRLTTSTPGTGQALVEKPDMGSLFWYLVTAEGLYGEGGAGNASQGPRQLNSSGACPDPACSHAKCSVGGPLAPSCSSCVAAICGQDPYCCNTAWDDICVEEVRTICGSLTCAESAGQCPHTLCSEGAPLGLKCDEPPILPSCVDAICLQDPYCCQTAWDDICVGEVASICGFNCN